MRPGLSPQTTGRTAIILMLGHPVGHVRGPAAINTWLAGAGIDAHVVPLDVRPEHLPCFIDQVRRIDNIAGLTITIPHKESVSALLDSLTAQAVRIGAVNWMRREPDGTLVGENLDGIGFVHGLRTTGIDLDGRRILQIGAGGVGRAIAFALAENHDVELDIVNRDPSRAQQLAQAVADTVASSRVGAPSNPTGFYDLVINATSLGLRPDDPLPANQYDVPTAAAYADVVNAADLTPFLARAHRAGAKTVPGGAMLQPQLSLMAEFLQLR